MSAELRRHRLRRASDGAEHEGAAALSRRLLARQREERGIDSLETVAYPPNAPLTSRPEWRGKNGRAATEVAQLAGQVCDRWQASIAICNCLYGVGLLFTEDMANAFARALNDWVAKEWLDRDPRLRASIVIPTQNTEYAVDEIERCAKDQRFVQILVLAMQEVPLGRRQFWPIYAAAERHGLPLGIHAGSTYRHSTTSLGWPSYYIEDYAATPRRSSRRWRAWSARACSPSIPGSRWCCSNRA